MATKFLTDFFAEIGREGRQSFRRCGILVGKPILAAQEDSDGNQPQNFFIARLAVGKIGRKTVLIFAGSLDQQACLPYEIISDPLACHNYSGKLVIPFKMAVELGETENAHGLADHGTRSSSRLSMAARELRIRAPAG